MKRSDWIGLSLSVGLHLLLLIAFSLMNLGAVEETPLGYIEVDFGPIAEGRAVQRAPVEQTDPVEDEVVEEQPEPEAALPEEAQPVQLPEQVAFEDDEVIQEPEAETISPEEQSSEAETETPEPQPEPQTVQPLGGGATDGTQGEASGDQGEGTDEQAASPFQIEGLNRVPIDRPLPRYAEKVNAVIRVRITVDPQGRIIRRIPLIKGSPALEQAVMQALQQWRFNPLPPNAPQENQTGTITFRFQLE